MNTIIYRGINQSKVAVARIFMDPKNPKHYILYVKGVGNFILPLATSFIATKTLAKLLVSLTTDEDDSKQDDNDKKENK